MAAQLRRFDTNVIGPRKSSLAQKNKGPKLNKFNSQADEMYQDSKLKTPGWGKDKLD